MAHAFSPIAAKPAFGNITQSDYASDYIQNKIAKLAYCSDVRNANCKKKFSQSELLLFNKGRLLNSYAFCAGTSLINEANLVAGLYTESDLSGVAVLCDVSGDACITPTAISSLDVPFYEHYLIDPDGQLFGNTPCGMTNFTKYMSVPVISILGSPIDLIAIAEIGSVLLSWTAPMTSDRSPITDYRVYWSTDNPDAPAPADAPIVGLAFAAPPVGWTLIDTKLVDSMYKVTGLDDGTTYYFKVEAVGLLGGGGAGTFSEVVSTTTLDIPGDPSGLVIVETGDGQVLLTWTAPESNGGSIITNYTIQMNNNNRVATSWNSYTHPVSTTTSITLSGLTPGEPYWFRVAAINRVGLGPYLLSSTFTTLSSFVTPTTTGSVTKSVINNYNSYVYGPGSSSFTPNKNMTINFLVVAGGTSGQANSLGYTSSGGGSGGILQGTLDITANNPINIVVGGGGNGLPNIGPEQTGYDYGVQGGASYILDKHTNISIISESCPTRSSPPNNYVSDSSAVDISHNYPGLPCTSTHHPDGPGNGAPGINGHIMSLYGGYKNIMCSSSGGGGGGGMDTTTYAVPSPYLGGIAGIGAGNGGSSNFESNNAGFGMDASAGSYGSGGGGAGSKSHGNYNYQVGDGAAGVVIIYFTYPIVDPASVTPAPISGPSAPISLIASIVGTNVSLTWNAPIYSGGAGATISNYLVRYSDSSSNGPWTNISTIYVTTNATIPLSLLSSNTTYYFQVVAINSVSTPGQWSGSASITTAPGPPTALNPVPSDGSVFLSWTAPFNHNDIYYGINYTTDETSWNSVPDISTNNTSCTIPNLINGTPYYFRVCSINSVYYITSSFINASATPFTIPNSPTGLVVSANAAQISLSWNQSIGDNITYIVQSISDQNTYITYDATSDTYLNIKNLDPGTSYSFQVAAINSAGTQGSFCYASDLIQAPDYPTTILFNAGVGIQAGTATITLLWTAPSLYTNKITGYAFKYPNGFVQQITNADIIPIGDNLSYTIDCSTAGLTIAGHIDEIQIAAMCNNTETGIFFSYWSIPVNE